MNYLEREAFVRENVELLTSIIINLGAARLLMLRTQHKWKEAV